MTKQEKMQELRVFAEQIRLETLRIIGSLGFGHVGGSMSMVEAMAVLYGAEMKVDPANPRWEGRDWFVLSKGHAGPVMYAALGLKGYYPVSDAYRLNQAGTHFPSHTDRNLTAGVDLTAGSLGQGIGEAVGAALGLKIQGRDSRVYVAVGDGECDEGAVWEAAQFAVHYGLSNLVCLVDDNKRQLDGPVEEVMSQGQGIGAKFSAFGWKTLEVEEGNDVEAVYDALEQARECYGAPTCIILHTVKGKGASFAEPTGAHSSQPTREEWKEALTEAEARYEKIRAQGKGGGES